MSEAGTNILLIEDNPGDAVLIREMLGDAGGPAVAAADRLASGLGLLQEEAFAVVLLDLGLPDSSGIETLLKIQAARPEVPVIVLTGLADEELATLAISRGAQDYLVKGRIDGELLSRAIRYAIERKKAEQLLKRSEERFRAFFESAGVGAVQLEPTSGRFVKVNDRYCQITGYRREELLAKTFLDIVHPDDRERDAAGFTRLVSGEIPTYVAEKRYIRKDGRLAWVQVTGTLLRENDGRPLGTAGIIQDITARKQAEEALRESESRYRTLFESIDEGFCIIEVLFDAGGKPMDFRFLETNPAFDEQTGLHDTVGKRMRELKPGHEEQWFERYGRIALTGEPERFTQQAKQLDDRWYDVYAFSVGRPEERKVAILFNDITARKRAEEELQKAQKLESIGLLAGGIAHDFNNILTAILGNITLARMFLPPGDKAVERLTVAEQASMRARSLSQQLLTFAKGGAPIKETIAVPQLISEAVALTLRGSRVKGESFFPPGLWPVEADESQLSQAISNLVLNGVQAMAEGGILTVAAANETLSRDNGLGLPEGRYVRIDVKDQGIGIPREEQEKIFDPYYTTKERGSGLGLAISFSIVKRHEGTIIVNSTPGEGSTFSIFLPASKKRMAAPKAEEHEEITAGTGRILVMDDEEAVNDVAAEMLRHLGYRVSTARNGAEAITIYQQALAAADPFDAVITDLTVPAGLGGKETVRRLLTLDPQAKVIVSSGYGNDPVMADYAAYGFKGVIAKPYRMGELSRTLQEVLGRREGSLATRPWR